MRSLGAGVACVLALAGRMEAGQIDVPSSGELKPGMPTGAVGASLDVPVPIQLAVPPLLGVGAPNLALTLTPTPDAAVPVLQKSAVPSGSARVVAANPTAAPITANASPQSGVDEGRALFDQSAAPREGDQAAPESQAFNARIKALVEPHLNSIINHHTGQMLDSYLRSGDYWAVADNLGRTYARLKAEQPFYSRWAFGYSAAGRNLRSAMRDLRVRPNSSAVDGIKRGLSELERGVVQLRDKNPEDPRIKDELEAFYLLVDGLIHEGRITPYYAQLMKSSTYDIAGSQWVGYAQERVFSIRLPPKKRR